MQQLMISIAFGSSIPIISSKDSLKDYFLLVLLESFAQMKEKIRSANILKVLNIILKLSRIGLKMTKLEIRICWRVWLN